MCEDRGMHALFFPPKYTFMCGGHRCFAEPTAAAVQRAFSACRPAVGEGVYATFTWPCGSEDELEVGVVEVNGTVVVDHDRLERLRSWFAIRTLDLICQPAELQH